MTCIRLGGDAAALGLDGPCIQTAEDESIKLEMEKRGKLQVRVHPHLSKDTVKFRCSKRSRAFELSSRTVGKRRRSVVLNSTSVE
jgi:hypothetical protein